MDMPLLAVIAVVVITSPIWASAIAHTLDERRRKKNGWNS